MGRGKSDAPPHPAMVQAVEQMFRYLEALAPDPGMAGGCRELPGIVLQRVQGQVLDRRDPRYLEVLGEYQAAHDDFLKALVAHPVGRSLALLAFGPEGVALLEMGRTPNAVTGVSSGAGHPARSSRQVYNCHHVIPKSVALAEGQNVNHPANLVLTKTLRRGRDQGENPHHFWHGMLLHPQLHNAPAGEIPIYAVRPVFPVYPPINQGFRTLEELRARLNQLGAAPLPEIWEKRILAFSAATRHRPYRVPEQYQQITRMFGDLFGTEARDGAAQSAARTELASRAASAAAEFLPPGAYLNGKPLPPDHKPRYHLPVTGTGPELSPLAKTPKKPPRTQSETRSRSNAKTRKPSPTTTPRVKT